VSTTVKNSPVRKTHRDQFTVQSGIAAATRYGEEFAANREHFSPNSAKEIFAAPWRSFSTVAIGSSVCGFRVPWRRQGFTRVVRGGALVMTRSWGNTEGIECSRCGSLILRSRLRKLGEVGLARVDPTFPASSAGSARGGR
jgi:hypothetical protein